MVWPFSSGYPELKARDVDGQTFDYIVIGGTLTCYIQYLISLFSNDLLTEAPALPQAERPAASLPPVSVRTPPFACFFSAGAPSGTHGSPASP